MGAYLSVANKECISDDGETEKMRYGSSAMQGWRLGMEDGHNCLPNIDDKTSMFAVYDGHGGAEVALYCSKYLPGVIRGQTAYKDGRVGQAMEDAFMEIDATLKLPSTIVELQHLAGLEPGTEEANAEEASALRDEANLPLGELLERYSYQPSKLRALRNQIDKNDILSPMVRKKPTIGDSANGHESSDSDQEESIPLRLHMSGEEPPKAKATPEGARVKEEITKCNGNGTDEQENGTLAEEDKENVEEEEEEEEDSDLDEEDEEEDDDEEEEGEAHDISGQREEPGSESGCTAVVALIQDGRVIVANAGDSRCVLSKGGKAIDLSIDHKPEDDIELTRIEKAGGEVTADGRVNGGLNLSRAIGDHCYKCNNELPAKEQMISAYPDIQTAQLTADNDFMVVACDGIWNVLTSQEVIDFVSTRIKASDNADKCNLSKICEELFFRCLAPDTTGDGTGCDNMTCIIVQFVQRPQRSPDRSQTSPEIGVKRKISSMSS